jgi:hypothetical protein
MSGYSDIGPLPPAIFAGEITLAFSVRASRRRPPALNRSPLPVIPPGSCPMDASVVIENQLTITLLRFR